MTKQIRIHFSSDNIEFVSLIAWNSIVLSVLLQHVFILERYRVFHFQRNVKSMWYIYYFYNLQTVKIDKILFLLKFCSPTCFFVDEYFSV